jgi:hypothetical protein
LYIGYSSSETSGFTVYTNKSCKTETKKTEKGTENVIIGHTTKMFKKYDLSNKTNGINELYIKSNKETNIENFYVLVVCKNTIIVTNNMSTACNTNADDGKKIITNGNNPILSWKFTLKPSIGYGVKTA